MRLTRAPAIPVPPPFTMHVCNVLLKVAKLRLEVSTGNEKLDAQAVQLAQQQVELMTRQVGRNVMVLKVFDGNGMSSPYPRPVHDH